MAEPTRRGRVMATLRRAASSLHVRVLVVNALVLFVPFVGVEFARVYENQLLGSLERDMRNQAVLLATVARRHAAEEERPELAAIVTEAATRTRTRVRLLDAAGQVVVDSHADGPPEGAEAPLESYAPLTGSIGESSVAVRAALAEAWPDVPQRQEVLAALRGLPSAYTRLRARAPSVFLFVSEPIRRLVPADATESPRTDAADTPSAVIGVVYITRSTQPVMMELHRIRRSLVRLQGAALALTLAVTLFLTLSITRPLSRLRRVAGLLAHGHRASVPDEGPREIREVGTALAQLHESLQSRLAYIRDFAADVAHEFKTPITSIQGAAEILGDPTTDPEARERFARHVLADAERLDRLVVRLLELSRLDASEAPFEVHDVGDIARRVADRFTTDEQAVEVSGTFGEAEVRAVDVERALINLVENGLRASPNGATIEIRGARVGEFVRIAVRDHGVGIPEELRARIFDRFFTTQASEGGTGLGLAIVRSVARAHGGDVSIDPLIAVGSRFVMTLRLRASTR